MYFIVDLTAKTVSEAYFTFEEASIAISEYAVPPAHTVVVVDLYLNKVEEL